VKRREGAPPLMKAKKKVETKATAAMVAKD